MKNLQNYDFLFENFTEIIGSLLESKSKLEEVNCELSKMSRELMKINYKNLYNEGEGHCGFKLISSSSNGIKKYITQPYSVTKSPIEERCRYVYSRKTKTKNFRFLD